MKFVQANTLEELEKKAQSLIGENLKINQNPLIKDGIWYQIFQEDTSTTLLHYEIISKGSLEEMVTIFEDPYLCDCTIFLGDKGNFCFLKGFVDMII